MRNLVKPMSQHYKMTIAVSKKLRRKEVSLPMLTTRLNHHNDNVMKSGGNGETFAAVQTERPLLGPQINVSLVDDVEGANSYFTHKIPQLKSFHRKLTALPAPPTLESGAATQRSVS